MSHVFISYCHENRDKFNDLLSVLKENGFQDTGTNQDIWYDRSIEAGSQWRVEIDSALKEAFAVVVIVTPESMKSLYVTYEWSWVIGNGTRLIPLLFKGSYDDVHPRLRDFHCEDCRNTIPSHVVETLKSYRTIPPDILYLNRLILNTVMPVRVLATVSLWLYPYTRSQVILHDDFQGLIEKTRNEAFDIYTEKLSEIMVTKAYAFTTKQLRLCRELTIKAQSLYDALNHLAAETQLYFPDHSQLIESTKEILVDFDQAVNLLYLEHWPYETLKSYLEVINKRQFQPENFQHVLNSSTAYAAISLNLPSDEYAHMRQLIETAKQSILNS